MQTALYDPPWYQDVKVLAARPTEFFPTARQTSAERLNAAVRLIAYVSLAVFLVNARSKYLLLGATGIGVVSLAHKFKTSMGRGDAFFDPDDPLRPRTSVARETPRCTRPTPENPFMNPTLGEFVKDPNRPPACRYEDVEQEIWENFDRGQFKDLEDVYDKDHGRRRFGIVPTNSFVPDTKAFREYLYGSHFDAVKCKENTSRCQERKKFIRV